MGFEGWVGGNGDGCDEMRDEPPDRREVGGDDDDLRKKPGTMKLVMKPMMEI